MYCTVFMILRVLSAPQFCEITAFIWDLLCKLSVIHDGAWLYKIADFQETMQMFTVWLRIVIIYINTYARTDTDP